MGVAEGGGEEGGWEGREGGVEAEAEVPVFY